MSKRKVGQITLKKIGDKWAACISGTPQELFNSFISAERMVRKLRGKYGRRQYEYKNLKKSNKRRKRKRR